MDPQAETHLIDFRLLAPDDAVAKPVQIH